jgi:A/G-specific adenine glycosylase
MPSHFISDVLIKWYEINKRDLPWRNINDPYCIWISEIILQQTRVNQGLDYYNRFVQRFPTVKSLAEAHEDEVLKYWQGLGYYSRARNLHKAARQIIDNFDGKFPSVHADVLSLSGVGNYTAAAICSFAYNQPYSVVDGNVYRVLSRIFGIGTPIDSSAGQKEFAALANELLNPTFPATHNQAIMEFGALQCVPVSPNCETCVLQTSCFAFVQNKISVLPVKSQKTTIKERFFNYIFIQFEGKTFLKQRTGNDIWRNLYEFPLIESSKLLTMAELLGDNEFVELLGGSNQVVVQYTTSVVKHILSHRHIYAQFTSVKISEKGEGLNKYIELPIADLQKYAVSRLTEQFLEKLP